MEDRSKWRGANAERQHRFRMAVDDAVHPFEALVDLAMDEPFLEPIRRVRVDGTGVADVILL